MNEIQTLQRVKRWPIIRHIRYLRERRLVYRWARVWGEAGVGLGHPNPADIEHLEAIWTGKA